MSSSPRLVHLPATTSSTAIVEALHTDAAVVIDNLINASQVSGLASDLAPYIKAGATGENEFGVRDLPGRHVSRNLDYAAASARTFFR